MVRKHRFHVAALFPGIQGPCGLRCVRDPCALVSSCSQGAGCDWWVRRDDNPFFGVLMWGDSAQARLLPAEPVSGWQRYTLPQHICVRLCVCPYLDVCPYAQDCRVKLFASPVMHACAGLLVCKRVCVCVGGDPCRKAGEGESAYLHWQLHKGKWTDFKAGVQLNCKASTGVLRAWAGRQALKTQTDIPRACSRLHHHICSTALVTVWCNESVCSVRVCEFSIAPLKQYKMYTRTFLFC